MRRALFVVLLGACDGDPSTTPVDAPPIPDARPDAFIPVDPPGSFDADEGGEVRLEYVNTADGNAATRATAFFYRDAGSTDYFPFPSFSGCTDVTGKIHWPVAQNPVAERQYLEPGSVLISGGPTPLIIPRRNEGTGDPLSRAHTPGAGFFFTNLATGPHRPADSSTRFSPSCDTGTRTSVSLPTGPVRDPNGLPSKRMSRMAAVSPPPPTTSPPRRKGGPFPDNAKARGVRTGGGAR